METIKLTSAVLMPGLLLILLSAASCMGQENEKKGEEKTKPDIRYKVDKKYDRDGKLIRYDSSYTYRYSNGGSLPDSVFSSIFSDFKRERSLAFPGFSMFGNDSAGLRQDDHFERMFRYQNEMFRRMEQDWWKLPSPSPRNHSLTPGEKRQRQKEV